MMEDDQQFCLRWNNHQSTLISVFDTLLENEKLVDCTLAAEGRIMKAHKVVLSACSPYFATLLQEQYDKHPIFILKDVKYQELRAMMDYMYRGEVNISQDQLAALLKAAESLQIKGLSDNRTGTAPRAEQQQQQQQQQHHRGLNVPGGSKLSGGYTLEAQTKRARVGAGPLDTQDISGSREGSSSPSRRRRKVRRRSVENAMAEPHDNSNSSQQQQSSLLQSNAGLAGVSAITAAASALASQLPTVSGVAATANAIATTQAAIASAQQQPQQQQQQPGQQLTTTTSVTKKTENVKGTSDAINTENVQVAAVAGGTVATGIVDNEAMEHVKTDKQNHKQKQTGGSSGKEGSELVIEPKSEYDEEGNDETCEDLTLDDEDMGMDDLDQNAGTSQGGEGSSQGYAAWQHDRSQDEILLSTQEAQQRDPQELKHCIHPPNINSMEDLKYEFKASMQIGNENSINQRFPCVVCGKSYLRKRHLQRHMRDECIGIPPRFSCELCPSRFRRKYHMVRHLTSKHGIPAAIAQQTTGNSSRNSISGVGTSSVGTNGNTSGCENGSVGSNGSHHGGDSPIPENLSIRKVDYKSEIALSPLSTGGGNVNCGNSSIGGVYTCGGNVGVMRSSPVPGTAAVGGANSATNTLPTYGLTGAITAISAAAAVIEEQAAAAAAAAASQQMLALHGNNIGDKDAMGIAADSQVAAANVKKEPITPSKAANMLDEDWKMKLSLQFISNSLLKERLMNTMPFAYNNN